MTAYGDNNNNNKLKFERWCYYECCLKKKQIQASYCLHKVDVQF